MKMLERTVIFCFLTGFILCQSLNELDLDKVKDAIEKGIGGEIPELPGDFNTTNLPAVEDVEKLLKDKCEKNGAPDAVEFLKEEQTYAVECIENYVNYTAVTEELEVAKKTGSMDDVFARYCKKWPQIHSCFDNVTSIARGCLDKKEESAMNKTMDLIDELQEFMCFKDGDRLAMFVAENGVECIKEQKDGIQECLNKTLSSKIPDPDDMSTLPAFLFTEENCDDFENIRECINVELEKCKNSSPANIIDALFKFLKKHLPCTDSVKSGKSTLPNSSWSSSVSLFVLVTSFLYVQIF